MGKFHNKTRQSPSIPRKLAREGKLYLLPVYYLLLTSKLAKEGIEHSGSYRFADHIYANKPQGRFVFGKFLDFVLLNLKSARSFRARYLHCKEEIHRLVNELAMNDRIKILAVPCGLARELFEVAEELQRAHHPAAPKIEWCGLDLDHDLINSLNARKAPLSGSMTFWCGEAFEGDHYGKPRIYDMIISTGFTEFLSDAEAVRFFAIVREKLKPKGEFVTSGMMPHTLSDFLMRNLAELRTTYRSERHLRSLAIQAGFKNVRAYRDGLQTMLIGIKD